MALSHKHEHLQHISLEGDDLGLIAVSCRCVSKNRASKTDIHLFLNLPYTMVIIMGCQIFGAARRC